MTRFIPVATAAAGILRIRKATRNCISEDFGTCFRSGNPRFPVPNAPRGCFRSGKVRFAVRNVRSHMLSFGKQPFAVHHRAGFCTACHFTHAVQKMGSFLYARCCPMSWELCAGGRWHLPGFCVSRRHLSRGLPQQCRAPISLRCGRGGR